METSWLAIQFNKQREIIEAAETPFAKLAMFILPVLSPPRPRFYDWYAPFIRFFLDIFYL